MFRFTIRDVLWLTVVVALGASWWLDRRELLRDVRAAWEMTRAVQQDQKDRAAREVMARYVEGLDKASKEGNWP
jgi:hypothetical protein